ncbi:MAG: hypothetical protein GY799_00600 [Desulfobulbaceae bacterium]|nr:hypothetical protein [Desulfobulbaceae bacterium]
MATWTGSDGLACAGVGGFGHFWADLGGSGEVLGDRRVSAAGWIRSGASRSRRLAGGSRA